MYIVERRKYVIIYSFIFFNISRKYNIHNINVCSNLTNLGVQILNTISAMPTSFKFSIFFHYTKIAHLHYVYNIKHPGSRPSKHETLTPCRQNVGPLSVTLAYH